MNDPSRQFDHRSIGHFVSLVVSIAALVVSCGPPIDFVRMPSEVRRIVVESGYDSLTITDPREIEQIVAFADARTAGWSQPSGYPTTWIRGTMFRDSTERSSLGIIGIQGSIRGESGFFGPHLVRFQGQSFAVRRASESEMKELWTLLHGDHIPNARWR